MSKVDLFIENSRFGRRSFNLQDESIEISKRVGDSLERETFYLCNLEPKAKRIFKRFYDKIIHGAVICIIPLAITMGLRLQTVVPWESIFFIVMILDIIAFLFLLSIALVWRKRVEVARFVDKDGTVAFEIIKEKHYEREFEEFVATIESYIESHEPKRSAGNKPRVEIPVQFQEPERKIAVEPVADVVLQPQRQLSMLIIDITGTETTTSLPVDGPHAATAEAIADVLLKMPGTRQILRLEHNEDEWLEIGWIKKGFVMRECFEGKCFYSNSPIKSPVVASEYIFEYQKGSICKPDEWFRVNGGQAAYDFVVNRFWFELRHKRYPVTSTWAQCLYVGVHVVALGWLAIHVMSERDIKEDEFWVPIVGVLKLTIYSLLFIFLVMIKFDYRDPEKKRYHDDDC